MKYFVLFFSIIFLFIIGPASALSNSGGGDWKYYKIITIEEKSGILLEDYQVPIEFSKKNFPTGVNSGGSDIRFVGNGKELEMWIEKFNTDDKTGKIWVKIPVIPANGKVKIKMYYGNKKAISVSDEAAALVFFDDFEDGIYTDKWEVVEGNWSESDGTIKQIEKSKDCAIFAKNISITDKLVIESKLRGSDITGVAARMTDNSSYWGSYTHIERKWIANCLKRYGGIISESSGTLMEMDKDTWYIIRSTIFGNNIKGVIYDSSLDLLKSDSNEFYFIETGDRVGLISNSYGEWDWIRVYKHVPAEPTYTFSQEYMIQEAPSIKLIKTASPSKIQVGEFITISIDVENPSNIDVESAELIDAIPLGFEIIGGSRSVYFDKIMHGEIQTIKYSIFAKEAGNFTFDPSTIYYKDHKGETFIDWSNSMIVQVDTPALTSTHTYLISKVVEPDEIWVDDFSKDTMQNYSWNISYHPSCIPGGESYQKYHHDAREYSFTKYISEGKLHITGDDWFCGRIFVSRTIQFDKPVQELRMNIKGKCSQGVLHIQAPIGAAIYENGSEFLKDIENVNEESIDINIFDHALISSVEKAEELSTEIVLTEPQKDFLLVLVAPDPWAWHDGEASQSFSTFDEVRIEGIYPVKKTSGMRIIWSIICILLVARFHKKKRF